MPELAKLGLNFPSFGVVLHALQQSSDVNVLSTPHILTSDNEEAEITVGQNVPFQAGFSPSTSASAPASSPAAAGHERDLAGAGSAGSASLFAPIHRQNVELKLTVKPQINESDFVRLVIDGADRGDRLAGPGARPHHLEALGARPRWSRRIRRRW